MNLEEIKERFCGPVMHRDDYNTGTMLEAIRALVAEVERLERISRESVSPVMAKRIFSMQTRMAKLKVLAKQRDKLKEENDRLREALGWYASETTYEAHWAVPVRPPYICHIPIRDDAGQRAREALKD